MEFLEEQWLLHVSLDEKAFPRDMLITNRDGKGRRIKVENDSEYLQRIKDDFGKFNLYTAVYSDKMREEGKINKLYIDLDSEDLHLAFKDMRRLTAFFEDAYAYSPRVYFTGKKGFAIYIDFPAIKLKNVKLASNFVVRKIITELNIKTADFSVCGDIARVSRVPYTLNLGSGLLCIPIDRNWTLETILSEAENPFFLRSVLVNQVCKEIVDDLERADEMATNLTTQTLPSPKVGNNGAEKRLETLLKYAPMIKDCRKRLIHFIVVPSLIQLGKSDYEIFAWVNQFLIKCGANPNEYQSYIRASIKRTKMTGFGSWSLGRFLLEFPESREIFRNNY
jgi:hypothetical protein